MKIGILYIGIGSYISLWDDFYKSSELYLFPDAEKVYFLFTDCDLKFPDNVIKIYQKNLGGVNNTLYRFQMFYEHRAELSICDYLFFINGNAVLKRSILSSELIPDANENYLSALSWHIYQIKQPKDFPYERNPKSTAYIPHNQGTFYYQGGLNGGRTKEYLDLIYECMVAVDKDAKQNIIAIIHDESHLNKYLLNKKVKVLDTIYGKPEIFFFPLHPKMVFRDKGRFFRSKGISYSKKSSSKPFWIQFFIDLSKQIRHYFLKHRKL